MPCKNKNNPCDKGCLVEQAGACTFYTGPDTAYLEIPNGMNLDDIIQGLDSIIATLAEQITESGAQTLTFNNTTGSLSISGGNSVTIPLFTGISVHSTPTVIVTGNGYSAPVTPSVRISPNVGNILSEQANGLYAIAPQQVNADWNAVGTVAEIFNKPNLAVVATSGDYNDLINTPPSSGPQVNSDWNASSGVSQILNKPNVILNQTTVQASANANLGGYFGAVSGKFGGGLSTGAYALEVVALPSSLNVAADFDGRIQADPGINPNDVVVMSQLAGGGLNIYNSNGTLTANRLVTGDGKSLSINGASIINLNVTNGSDTADLSLAPTNTSLTDSSGNSISLDATLGINASGPMTLTATGGTLQLQGASTGVVITSNTQIAGDVNITGEVAVTGNSTFIGDVTVSPSFDVSIQSPTVFTSTAAGIPAVSASQFVVLSQLQGYTVINNTSLASTAVDAAYMNTNYSSLIIGARVMFTNLSDDATKVLAVTKLTASTWSVNADAKLT